MPGAGHRATRQHGRSRTRAGCVPRGRATGRDVRRPHRPGAGQRGRRERNRVVAGTHASHRSDRSGRPHDDRRSRRAAAAHPGGSREARVAVPGGLRRARLGAHRRQRGHQCRRQRRDPVRHDARLGAGTRSGARRRHRDSCAEPDAQEQRGLRREATVHRLRGDARRHHAAGAALARKSAQHAVGAGGLPDLCRRDPLPEAHRRRARRFAVGIRADVERVLPAGDDAAVEGNAAAAADA